MKLLVLLVIFFYTLTSLHSYAATDSISFNQSIRDGETMVSASGSYELGFFSPLANTKRYLGVWYKFSNETVVWVANREMPLNDTSGILQVTRQGILAIRSSNNITVWQSSSADDSKQAQNPIAQILDTGNFVVREADDTNEDNHIWQSFDYLGDTYLPGSKIGRNLVSGMDWYLQSWKSISDPSLGDFTKRLNIRGYPQTNIKKGETVVFRSGPWNGLNFGGVHGLNANPVYAYRVVFTEEEIYLMFVSLDKSIFFRMILTSGGVIQQFTWNTSTWKWDVLYTSWRDKCDSYALCGAFGICDISNSPMCSCLEGFMPKFPWAWKLGNWSGGCARKNDFVCGAGERFQRIDEVKLPDSSHSWFNRTMNLTECERECIRNCSCTAYSTLDISTGSGCLFWIGELLDTRIYAGNGQSFYLRLSTSESDTIKKTRPFSGKKLAGIVAGFTALVMVIVVALILHKRRKSRQRTALATRNIIGNGSIGSRKEEMELLIFGLNTIAVATNNFSSSNKLGEGGFGAVYKGTLVEGQDIAVKRLSKSSGQGLDEFKTEVTLIAKLQHRNLVRLLGCCIHEDEKMLVYEYMPNNSLDSYIFDTSRRKLLDWNKRSHIIAGIARGLVYLHQDSRLRIIHRDLKASNILLDNNMNPKISDFGIARSFGADQTHAKTKRVVGTYGYMAPEYAVHGLFSMKSDVFSFGVLVLEIVSGKKNRGFYHPDHDHNLLGHAWMLWTRGTPLEMIDECLADSCNPSEVTRCIHVALLCVQRRPENRPTMSTVVQTLSGENLLCEPQQPGFFMGRYSPEADNSSGKNAPSSSYDTTITVLEPR